MIEDMAARKLNPHTQRSHISSCKRFAAWLKSSPDTATPDEVRRSQLHLIESGASICNRNPVMIRLRLQMLAPLSMRCSWERRTSSGVAVSGELFSQAANRLQLEMWLR